MAISHDEVRAIAELARLELTEDEITRYAEQLSAILDYFVHLQSVDTSAVEAIASVLPIDNVLRADQAAAPLPPEQAIANAPESDQDQFRVSAVLPE